MSPSAVGQKLPRPRQQTGDAEKLDRSSRSMPGTRFEIAFSRAFTVL